ncbi:MAG TPA: outer membrane beta-barrel protein [Chitinophagaceae bacterium]
MKKITLAILLSCIITTLNAQTEKGDWLIGGRIDINTGENSTHIGFSPNAGYFVTKNVAVGGNLTIDYSETGSIKYTDFGIGPFARFYFTNAMVRPLIQVSVDYISSKAKGTGFSSTNTGSKIFLGGGAAVFINPNVSIEGIMGYSHTKYTDFDGNGGFNLGIGFQVYLNKGQVNKLRGK